MALSKSHQDYWTNRLKKRSYRDSAGRMQTVEEWQVYIQHKGHREWFPLGPNKVKAAKRAADIYISLKKDGWQPTIKEFKGVMVVKNKKCTIGEFLAAVEKTGTLTPKTFANYYRWLRTIAAQLKGIPDTNEKYDYRGGGLAQWRKKVDSIPLDYLTPERVSKWRDQFIAKAGQSPILKRKAIHSANSAIRNARSLFNKKLLQKIEGLEIPSPHPFEGVELAKGSSMRYQSTVKADVLYKNAQEQLAKDWPEQYKIFLLSLFAGLRRNEIDKLLWSSVNWEKRGIRVEETQYFKPKTETSVGFVALDDEGLDILKGFYADNPKAIFVIKSNKDVKFGTHYRHYRANYHFAQLTDWLRKQGIDTPHPVHTLRKEFGRMMTENHGIYAASQALRHASIHITDAHYAADNQRKVVSSSNLASSDE